MDDIALVMLDRYNKIDTVATGKNDEAAPASPDISLPQSAGTSRSDTTQWNHMPKKPKQSHFYTA